MEWFVVLVGTAVVVGSIVGLKWHPFAALILGAASVGLLSDSTGLIDASQPTTFPRIAVAFGKSCREIGLLIAFAAIIGVGLTETRAAHRIVAALLRAFKPESAPKGLVVAGFLLGIPVFFDTVFLLLIPIARALWQESRKNYLLILMSIVVGGTMAHSLVPPTPGPLLVAASFKVEIGVTLVVGLIIGSLAATTGYLFAKWLDRRWPIDGDHSLQQSETIDDPNQPTPEIARVTDPPLLLAMIPIALPLFLLALGTILSNVGEREAEFAKRFALTEKNFVMGIGAISALILLQLRVPSAAIRSRAVQRALADGGVVLLITAAGGTFGALIHQTGIGNRISQSLPSEQVGYGLLVVSFLITGLVRIAQGSATVAMITAAGIVTPIAQSFELPFHSVYLVMAIGCGSKLLPWMNDSGFWLVGRMGGLDVKQTFRSFSLTLTVMGFAGGIATLIGAWLVPLK